MSPAQNVTTSKRNIEDFRKSALRAVRVCNVKKIVTSTQDVLTLNHGCSNPH